MTSLRVGAVGEAIEWLPDALRQLGCEHFITKTIVRAMEQRNQDLARWVLLMLPKYVTRSPKLVPEQTKRM